MGPPRARTLAARRRSPAWHDVRLAARLVVSALVSGQGLCHLSLVAATAAVNRDQLIADLRQAEGVRTTVYDDTTGQAIRPGSSVHGHPTIGVGHRLDLPLSDAFIDALLDADITDAVQALDVTLPWWTGCTEPQQRALVELAFNLGIAGLAEFERFLLHLRAGQGHAAGCELSASVWAQQVGRTRAHRLVVQVQGGEVA